MNVGLLLKSGKEILPVTVVCGSLELAVVAILSYVLPTFQSQFAASIQQIEFVASLLRAMLGTRLADQISPDALLSIAWVHPVVLSIGWAHATIVCSRVPAGEIERGTIDILLGLPVSRWNIMVSETVVCFAAGVAIALSTWAGSELGGLWIKDAMEPSTFRRLMVVVNLLCLNLAVGSFAWLVSAVSSRRGKAITIVFVAVLASFLLNFLAPFWEWADRLKFVSVLEYYRPMFILRDGAWPFRDIIVLLTVALLLWVAAGTVFSRRDLPTG